jgi:hypothetical protein
MMAAVLICSACCAVAGVFILVMRHEDEDRRAARKTPRQRARFAAGAARAARRVTAKVRRLPGAIRRKLTRDLPTEDRISPAAVLRIREELRHDRQPGPFSGRGEAHAPTGELWQGRPLDYQPAPPLAGMLSADTLARGFQAVK